MARSVGDIMTQDPRTVDEGNTLVDAAKAMAEADIGSVVVVDESGVAGLITDRDIVVRAVAEGRDPGSTAVKDVCSADVVTVTQDQDLDEAIRLMREHDLRRVPVVQDGRPVGILSLGDVAVEREPDSTLADISAAPPND
jgi:CBS domain-containing protein